MNSRSRILRLLALVAVIAGVIAIGHWRSTSEQVSKLPQEYLQFVGTRFVNRKDHTDGTEIIFFLYSIAEQKVVDTYELGKVVLYPAACMDFANQKIYYSGSDNDLYDNLYVYDIVSQQIKQLTNDKMLFNDLFIAGGQLYGNIAPEGITVVQPAIVDVEQSSVRYLNATDDDTWFHSFSYSLATDKLLGLTCSDSEMRTERVARQTFIRPKKVLQMNLDFSAAEIVFETEAFEVIEARQLDVDRIIMVTENQMASGKPRQLQILNVSNGELAELHIEGLIEPQSMYPDKNAERLYILGRGKDTVHYLTLFDYDMKTQTLTELLTDYQFPEGHRIVINFTYTACED